MDKQQINLVLKRLMIYAGVNTEKELSRWLADDINYIGNAKAHGVKFSGLLSTIVDRCILERLDLNYILKGDALKPDPSLKIKLLRKELADLRAIVETITQNKGGQSPH